jgi:biopolymer transport protein ExbD
MKLSRTAVYNPALFSIVPLVNVLFLVLLYYALSSSYVFQPGIAVTPPVSSFLLGPQRNPQIVSIASTPKTSIYFRDQKMTLRQLAEHLDEPGIRDRTLVVVADRHTSYARVMEVMNLGLERGFSVVLAGSGSEAAP